MREVTEAFQGMDSLDNRITGIKCPGSVAGVALLCYF